MSEAQTSQPGAPLWMRVLLILSLAVNILILGIVLGAYARWGDGGGGERLRGVRDLAPPPFVLALEREDRQVLIADLQRQAGEAGRGREAVRADLLAFLAALRSETFDAETVRALMGEERGRSQARQAAGEDIYVAYLEALGLEERRAYADRLERILRRLARR